MAQSSPVEERSLIASGAAAGLAAAFNAPIAGLLFVVEEVYHHFSRFFWVSTLAASLVANFVSLLIFGLTPVLDMPDNIPTHDPRSVLDISPHGNFFSGFPVFSMRNLYSML